MAAVLNKPSVNVFALLESDDPGDSVGAKAKADDAARMRGSFSKKQPPQMSAWKINKLKAEADAAAKQQQQLAAASTKTKTNIAGNNRKPQQPATIPSRDQVMTTAKGNNVGKHSTPQRPVVQSRAQVSGAASAGMNGMNKKPKLPAGPSSRAQVGAAGNAAMNMKPKQPAAASAAHVNTTANAGGHKRVEQFQQQQQVAPARGNLGDQLFAYANSVRTLVYKNRKQNSKDEKGGQPNGAAVKDAPAPVREETSAPV